MSQTTIEDRCRGVLIGLAAGDRIGGPIRMALLLAESLECYLGWWREGAFDIGPVNGRTLALMASGMPADEATAQVHREFGVIWWRRNSANRAPASG